MFCRTPCILPLPINQNISPTTPRPPQRGPPGTDTDQPMASHAIWAAHLYSAVHPVLPRQDTLADGAHGPTGRVHGGRGAGWAGLSVSLDVRRKSKRRGGLGGERCQGKDMCRELSSVVFFDLVLTYPSKTNTNITALHYPAKFLFICLVNVLPSCAYPFSRV